MNETTDQTFQEVFDHYKSKIFSFYIGCGVNAFDAQDLTQDTFVKIYKNLADRDEQKSLSGWIFTITSNTVKNFWRSKQRFSKLRTERTLTEASPESILLKKEEVQGLMFGLSKIPLKYKIILMLRYTNELSYEEISQIMGISVNRVSVYLYRAKQKLKKIMSESEGENNGLSKSFNA